MTRSQVEATGGLYRLHKNNSSAFGVSPRFAHATNRGTDETGHVVQAVAPSRCVSREVARRAVQPTMFLEMQMNRLVIAIVSAFLLCAGPGAYAQSSMAKDAMSHDVTSKDAMTHDVRSKDAMTHDAISKDAMSKDTTKTAPRSKQQKDAMAHDPVSKSATLKDAMSKDAMKK